MAQTLTLSDAQTAMLMWLSQKATQQLKLLLETRHLYQKVEIEASEINKVVQALQKEIVWTQGQAFAAWLSKQLGKERFALGLQQPSVVVKGSSISAPGLTLVLPHASLFCKTCDRREAFAPVWYMDVSNEIREAVSKGFLKRVALPDSFQMLPLAYQCQRCLGTPEGFLVRREGWILSLHGRSPIERVEVPNYIPKIESRFYRDAVIAFNTGKTLAALFYLRTFVEQFARRVTNMTGRATGEEILDAYYETLSADHKDHMPSLREWYDKLSEALHSAQEGATLFEAARAEIEKHFDIRRVFHIAEPKPVAAASGEAKPSNAQ